MPLYRWSCLNESCKHEFEQLLLGSEKEEEVSCPKCGNKEKTKVIGATSFVLKGQGWARDKYRGGKKRD